jgi:hypothetical protein
MVRCPACIGVVLLDCQAGLLIASHPAHRELRRRSPRLPGSRRGHIDPRHGCRRQRPVRCRCAR